VSKICISLHNRLDYSSLDILQQSLKIFCKFLGPLSAWDRILLFRTLFNFSLFDFLIEFHAAIQY